MIDMKEAWDSGHPDKIASLSHSRLKELHNACEWYSDSKRTRYPRGFKMRARALERELQNRRHDTATVVSIVAAAIALLSAVASLYGALHSPRPETKKTHPQQSSILEKQDAAKPAFATTSATPKEMDTAPPKEK